MFEVIRQGQRVAVWNRAGSVSYVDGPRLLFKAGKTTEKLKQYRAHADQYLRICYQDGHCEHRRGPTSEWFDPVQHYQITICDALPLDSNEAIVVYENEKGKVSRQVIRGPGLFVPNENQWLHEFFWHGAKGRDHGTKIPKFLNFTKLRVIPDQMYFHVRDVRTSDDAVLTIKLMIFFELNHIEEMLNQTHDPIADFINAVTADTIEFAASRTFEQFKSDTDLLNRLDSYQNLASRAPRIGYEINKVVFRGYSASDTLQSMHDGAIEARTRLKLEAETEAQEQELADLRLKREAIRAEQERSIAAETAEHSRQQKRLDMDAKLQHQQNESRQHRESLQQDQLIELEHLRSMNEEKAAFLTSVSAMEVDMTRYLVAQYQHPDRVFRVEGDSDTQVHLHETSNV